MPKYKIFYGLGGGFGGASEGEVEEFENEDIAEEYAFSCACEKYDNYAGSYGLRDIQQIIEQDEVDEDEAEEIFNGERESWLDYYVELVEE